MARTDSRLKSWEGRPDKDASTHHFFTECCVWVNMSGQQSDCVNVLNDTEETRLISDTSSII